MMRITTEGMALVAAGVGKEAAEHAVRLSVPEQNEAELAMQRAVLRNILEVRFGTHPAHRSSIDERIEATRARIRKLASAVSRHNKRVSI